MKEVVRAVAEEDLLALVYRPNRPSLDRSPLIGHLEEDLPAELCHLGHHRLMLRMLSVGCGRKTARSAYLGQLASGPTPQRWELRQDN